MIPNQKYIIHKIVMLIKKFVTGDIFIHAFKMTAFSTVRQYKLTLHVALFLLSELV